MRLQCLEAKILIFAEQPPALPDPQINKPQ